MEPSSRTITKAGERITPDYLTQDKSILLVSKIRNYWRRRGYDNILIWTEPSSTQHNCTTWAVRSDMKNGMPQS